MDERQLLETAMRQILAVSTIKRAWDIARATLKELDEMDNASKADDE